MRLKVGQMDLGELLRAVSKQAYLHNPRCHVKVKGLNGAEIRGDQTRLEAALLNIIEISSALAGGKCEIALNLGLIDDGLVVEVCNTSLKIPLEQVQNLRDTLLTYRYNSRHSGQISQIREAIEAHGGKLWVGNTDKGFSINFSLPFQEMKMPLLEFGGDHTPYNLPSASFFHDLEQKHPTVMIIGDDRDVVSLLRVSLNYSGWRVTFTRSGVEAIQQVIQQRPDVILLDWKSPGREALKTLERLRNVQNSRPKQAFNMPVVLICSDNPVATEWYKLKELGIAGFLSKPFELEEARRMLSQVMLKK